MYEIELYFKNKPHDIWIETVNISNRQQAIAEVKKRILAVDNNKDYSMRDIQVLKARGTK